MLSGAKSPSATTNAELLCETAGVASRTVERIASNSRVPRKSANTESREGSSPALKSTAFRSHWIVSGHCFAAAHVRAIWYVTVAVSGAELSRFSIRPTSARNNGQSLSDRVLEAGNCAEAAAQPVSIANMTDQYRIQRNCKIGGRPMPLCDWA